MRWILCSCLEARSHSYMKLVRPDLMVRSAEEYSKQTAEVYDAYSGNGPGDAESGCAREYIR